MIIYKTKKEEYIMKNYINWLKTTKEIKKKDYILNYEIKDREIIIHYAKGKSLTIANTKENIKVLEEKLKAQISSFDKTVSDDRLVSIVLYYLFGIIFQIQRTSELYVIVGIADIFLISAIIGTITLNIKKKDLKKNKLLLENLERINKRFNENPSKVYEVLKTKDTELDVAKEEDNSIKLNDADLFTMRGVSSLVENLDKESEFTCVKKNMPKMRIKKRNHQEEIIFDDDTEMP